MINGFRFNPGDLVTSTVTGFDYVVNKTSRQVSSGRSTETMELMRLVDGHREVIDSSYYGSWVLTNTLNRPPKWAPAPQLDPNGNAVFVDPNVQATKQYVDKQFTSYGELPDLRGKFAVDFAFLPGDSHKSPGCQHDWVTWTGLHGTVTDCTKCKAKR